MLSPAAAGGAARCAAPRAAGLLAAAAGGPRARQAGALAGLHPTNLRPPSPAQVYTDLEPAANFLRLRAAGRGLAAAWSAIRGLEAAVEVAAWYWALSGINILLLLARCGPGRIARRHLPACVQHTMRGQLLAQTRARPPLPAAAHYAARCPPAQPTAPNPPHPRSLLRRMDFQPRLGVITRSLRLALPDLLHFALVAGAVFLGYSVMAFLIFGSSVPQFSGLGPSVATCFGMMLGDFGDVARALGQLGGVQASSAAAARGAPPPTTARAQRVLMACGA